MSGFWDENRQSEYEQIEETYDEEAKAILAELDDDVEYEDEIEDYDDNLAEEYEDEEEYEEENNESAYKLDRRESGVVNESMIRLEQARLYDMLIKHDLFAGVKAHPNALRNVQNELKKYIVERLEILLGIKQEKIANDGPREFAVESPFNDVEIDFLKALSYKGTKGASAQAKTKSLVANEIQPLEEDDEDEGMLRPLGEFEEEPELVPMRRPVPKRKPKSVQPTRKVAPKRVAKPKPTRMVVPKNKPVTRRVVPKKGAVPKKATTNAGIKRKSRRKEMSKAEAEEIAREDIARMEGRNTKPAHEMTAKELVAANKRIAKENNKPRPEGAKDMPNTAQVSTLYQQQQMTNNNTGFNTLLQKVLHDKNK